MDYSGTWEWQAKAGVDLAGRVDSSAERESEATATVGGEVAYQGRTCRWFGLGGDIGGYWDGTNTALTGRQELTFCLPYPAFRPETRLTLHQDLRPVLAATPTVRAARMRGGAIEMLVRTLHVSATNKAEVTTHLYLLTTSMGFELLTQEVEDTPARTNRVHFGFDIVRASEYGNGFLGNDRELSILVIEGEILGNPENQASERELDVFAMNLLAFRAKSARLGRRTGLYGDMSLGVSFGDMQTVQVIAPQLEFTLMGGTPARSYGVGYTRTLTGTNYSALLMEDRISGWWRLADDRNATTFRGFAALTDLVDANGRSGLTVTGGVGLNRDMMLADYLRLALRAEVARSYYATLDGESPLDAAWVVQLGVSASAFKSSR